MPAQNQPSRRWAVVSGGDLLAVGHDVLALNDKADRANRGLPIPSYRVIPVCSYTECSWHLSGGPGTLEGMSDSARYCTDRCRAAQWKSDHNYGRHEPRQRRTNAGPPPLVGVKIDRTLNDAVKPVAEAAGLSVREFVDAAIREKMERSDQTSKGEQ